MRISADQTDPGFGNRAKFAVTLNGKPEPWAITADEELGTVHIGNEFGQVRIERGVVRIECLQ
jgi:hypothetical protein